MYLVAIAWMYVVVMMTVVEATSSNGTVIGAVFTFFLYGALPLGIVLYILRTPARKRARLLADASAADVSAGPPDGGDHPAGDAIAAERKEP
ncbi:MAG: hypothetical protein Q7T97_03000 [Burkholderiaceae bacterium]|nr:hypothetical protein [Burkholderiaceae bacterium]